MTGLPEIPSLGIFDTGLSQNARLITLTSAQQGDLPESLVVEQFTGREAVNELFCTLMCCVREATLAFTELWQLPTPDGSLHLTHSG